ncbi:hypothetical protein COLO4_01835, partial [Corchorus olitorius]
HIRQHGNDGALAVRHYIDGVVTCTGVLPDFQNQIRQPLSSKKLINAVRIAVNRVGKVPAVKFAAVDPRHPDGPTVRAGPQHVRNAGGCVSKGAAILRCCQVQYVAVVIVAEAASLSVQLFSAVPGHLPETHRRGELFPARGGRPHHGSAAGLRYRFHDRRGDSPSRTESPVTARWPSRALAHLSDRLIPQFHSTGADTCRRAPVGCSARQ